MFIVEQWVIFFPIIALAGLDVKRNEFNKNIKARIIWSHYKKYKIKKKINFMNSSQIRTWCNFIFLLKRRRACRLIRQNIFK